MVYNICCWFWSLVLEYSKSHFESHCLWNSCIHGHSWALIERVYCEEYKL